jgi:hypothetical protein
MGGPLTPSEVEINPKEGVPARLTSEQIANIKDQVRNKPLLGVPRTPGGIEDEVRP